MSISVSLSWIPVRNQNNSPFTFWIFSPFRWSSTPRQLGQIQLDQLGHINQHQPTKTTNAVQQLWNCMELCCVCTVNHWQLCTFGQTKCELWSYIDFFNSTVASHSTKRAICMVSYHSTYNINSNTRLLRSTVVRKLWGLDVSLELICPW